MHRLLLSAALLLVATAARSGESDPALAQARADVEAFAAWLDARGAGPIDGATLQEARALLERRRQGMALLIASAPQTALELTLPASQRLRLPAALADGLEQRVDGMGLLTELVTMFHDGAPDHAHHAEPDPNASAESLHRSVRTPVAVLGEQRYFAYAAGQRVGVRSLEPVPIHGVALDGHLAISEQPWRALESGEDRSRFAPSAARACAGSEVLSGDRLLSVCAPSELQALEQQWAVFEQQGRDGDFISPQAEVRSTWTTGPKTFLYIRARFADQDASALPSLATVQGTVSSLRDHMRAFSYTLLPEITATYTDVVALPKTAAEYNGDDIPILLDAANAAAAANPAWNRSNFNFYAVRFVGGPGSYAGQAYVGATGIWMKSDNGGVAAHELGHNLGLLHANSWTTAAGVFDPAGEGSNSEYGNPYDRLGGGSGTRSHFTASFKERLSWLLDHEIRRLWGSGGGSVVAHDIAAPVSGPRSAALFLRERLWMPSVSSSQSLPSPLPSLQRGHYWVEARSQYSEFASSLPVNLQGSANHLLDLTPRSRGGKADGGLYVGRTLSDPGLGLHITALGVAGSPPEFQYRVNVGGFAGNRAPTVSLIASALNIAAGGSVIFTANAGDADGDALAYSWEWGDGTFGAVNAATASRTFASAGHYRVRVVASDMKGGRASASALITVGSPTTFRASGRVLIGGQPLEGVHVNNGATGNSYRGTYTDSDGRYEITGLASGNVTLSAGLTGYRLSAGFTNPVAIGGNAADLDFSAEALSTVSIVATDAIANENPSDTLSFRVSRSGPTATMLRVWFDRAGTASSSGTSGDYSFSTGANRYVEIPAGANFVDLVATPNSDTQGEPDESVIITLADGVDYELSYPPRAQGVIRGNAGPANDHFANAIAISGSSATVNGSTSFATLEVDEPPHNGRLAAGASAWWRWTAPASGLATIDTQGSAVDTLLAVYAGDALESLVPLAANNNVAAGSTWSQVQLQVQAGLSYRIAIAQPTGAPLGGNVRLNLSLDTSGGDAVFSDGFEN